MFALMGLRQNPWAFSGNNDLTLGFCISNAQMEPLYKGGWRQASKGSACLILILISYVT